MPSRDRIAAGAIASVIAIAPLLIGSAPRWAACITAALALAAAATYVNARRLLQRRPLLLVFLGAVIAVTALQLIPLPAFLVELLSPERARLAAANAAALGDPAPGWIALSYDPPATLVELAKLCGYAALGFACMRLCAGASGRRWVAGTVAVVGAGMAAIAMAHFAVGAERVFGLYEPRYHHPRYLAPLINENHLAGFLALSAPVALAMAVRGRGNYRAAWIFAALLSAVVCVLTESRGGAIALVLGLAMAGVLFALQRRQPGREIAHRVKLSVVIPAAIVGVCTVILIGVLAASGVAKQLSDTRTTELTDPDSKFAAWRSALQLAADNPLTGVGRGGFEAAFTRVDAHKKTFSHVENEYLQALVDWGLPVGGALIGLLVWLALAAARRWRTGAIEIGALSGLAALGAHSTVDFGVELPGIAVSALALAAIVLPGVLRVSRAPSGSGQGEGGRARRVSPPVVRGVLLALGFAVVAAAASPIGCTAREDADALLVAIERASDGGGGREVTAAAREMLRRHPSDYVIAGRAARAFWIAGDRDRARAVMNRALALNRHNAGLHYQLARMLAVSQRPQQALVAYADALALAPDPTPIVRELVTRFPDPAIAARGLPLAPDRVPLIMNTLRAIDRDDVAMAYVEAALSLSPDDLALLRQASAAALAQGRTDEAVAWGMRAHARLPDAASALLAARALDRAGRTDEAIDVLEAGAARARQQRDAPALAALLVPLADMQLARQRYDAARRSLDQILNLGADRERARACHRKLAQVEDALGNAHKADWHRAQAVEPSP